MQEIMFELAELCGFSGTPTTFPELFAWMFRALCGTAILASVIKVMLYASFHAGRIFK